MGLAPRGPAPSLKLGVYKESTSGARSVQLNSKYINDTVVEGSEVYEQGLLGVTWSSNA